MHLHEHIAAGLIVGGVCIFLAGSVDAFHQLPSGDVVFINIQNLLASLEGEVVAASCKKPLAFLDEFFDLFDLGDMTRGQRAAIYKARGIHELRTQGKGWCVIGIVGRLESHLHDRLGIIVAALGDALAGEFHGGIAKSIQCLLLHIGHGGATLRQDIHRTLEVGVGRLVIQIRHRLVGLGNLTRSELFFLLEELNLALDGALNSGELSGGNGHQSKGGSHRERQGLSVQHGLGR